MEGNNLDSLRIMLNKTKKYGTPFSRVVTNLTTGRAIIRIASGIRRDLAFTNVYGRTKMELLK